ncbi:LytTR family transcriptional regulator [Solibacillus sp. R5-41]|uniref:LytTR family DNA-binding domain-containing protein n=1 Tax=Solibacillus sp. R5-41 TaxID=2048654 RepID=UPI000C127EED|nr:LytTR family DNA-binding domain-containing protein [Solibacillus sp. R5-41]ATP38645.1 LytTR family transcriptional regulator [Solibacillus sp. R5-41]
MIFEDLKISTEEIAQFNTILEEWIPNDASIAIAFEDMFVYFRSGHQKISLALGSKVPTNSIAYKVLKTRKKTEAIMENLMFETPYYAIGYPIIINEKFGALVVVLPPLFNIKNAETYRFITGKQAEDWSPIPIDQISHFESLQKRTWFYKNGEQYKTTVTLKELQIRLPDTFIRIHRSYIVNVYSINKISRDLTSNFIVFLKDGTELPISQSYINNLRAQLEF